VRPPKPGDYILHVFAKREDEDHSGPYGIILEYEIKVGGKGHFTEWLYPKHYGDFEQHRHYLFSPTTLNLEHDTTHHFKVKHLLPLHTTTTNTTTTTTTPFSIICLIYRFMVERRLR